MSFDLQMSKSEAISTLLSNKPHGHMYMLQEAIDIAVEALASQLPSDITQLRMPESFQETLAALDTQEIIDRKTTRLWLVRLFGALGHAASIIKDKVATRVTHRHTKGGLYRLHAKGRLESNLIPVAIYQAENGSWWVRDWQEFRKKFQALSIHELNRTEGPGPVGEDGAWAHGWDTRRGATPEHHVNAVWKMREAIQKLRETAESDRKLCEERHESAEGLLATLMLVEQFERILDRELAPTEFDSMVVSDG